jgi:hypothetical protein
LRDKEEQEHRRQVVFCNLRHNMAMLWALTLGSFALAYLDKFTPIVGTFVGFAFLAVAGESVLVIGSWVFGAAWEARKYFEMLKGSPDEPA